MKYEKIHVFQMMEGTATDPFCARGFVLNCGRERILDSSGILPDTCNQSLVGDLCGKEARCVTGW